VTSGICRSPADDSPQFTREADISVSQSIGVRGTRKLRTRRSADWDARDPTIAIGKTRTQDDGV